MHVDFIDKMIVIWLFIIMGALAFGLVNTLATAVMERARDLGMLHLVSYGASFARGPQSDR